MWIALRFHSSAYRTVYSKWNKNGSKPKAPAYTRQQFSQASHPTQPALPCTSNMFPTGVSRSSILYSPQVNADMTVQDYPWHERRRLHHTQC